MALTNTDVRNAGKRMQERLQTQPRAVAARYDRRAGRIVVSLSNGLPIGSPRERQDHGRYHEQCFARGIEPVISDSLRIDLPESPVISESDNDHCA